MRLKEKIKEAQKRPKNYFEENIDQITYTENDDIEELIPLLTVAAYIEVPDVFTKLLKTVGDQIDKIPNLTYEYYYYLALASFSKHNLDYVSAVDYCLKSNHLAYKLKEGNFIVESLRFMGSVYQQNNDTEMALYYSKSAIKELIGSSEPILASNVYMQYGVVLVDLKDYRHAIEAYKKALAILEKIDSHEQHIHYYLLMINIGEAYMLLGELNNAEIYYDKGAQIAETHDHESTYSSLLLLLADFYKSVANHKKSSYYYEKYAKKKNAVQVDVNTLDKNRDKDELKSQMNLMKNLREKNDILLKRVMQLHDELNHDKQFLIKNQILEEELIKGLQKNEIVAFYQLKWSNTKERPIGAEALIRWIKDGSIVPPGAFISEIEESSIIIDVSKRVISDSMKVCKTLVDNYNPDFVMSVNIAPYQLNNQELCKFIEGELLIHKLPAKNFEIEIIERSFIDSNPRISEELYAIKDLGVSIALDDFGTGYSSLSCINDLPINSVKIDKSLIMNSETDIKTGLLLNGIIALMKNLKMEIVIEGVEHENQVELLKSYNCEYLQGYYFSKPIKEEDFISSMMSYIK